MSIRCKQILVRRIYLFKIISISFCVVPANLKHLGDKAYTWSALDLNDDIQRIRNVCLNGAVRHLYAALQHASCEPRNALGGNVCMYRSEGSIVACCANLQD